MLISLALYAYDCCNHNDIVCFDWEDVGELLISLLSNPASYPYTSTYRLIMYLLYIYYYINIIMHEGWRFHSDPMANRITRNRKLMQILSITVLTIKGKISKRK